MSSDLYDQLARPFENTFKDVRGGHEIEYITGQQCIARLNEVLGLGGWAFRIIEHGINGEADEAWVLGELTVHLPAILSLPERSLSYSQFGSQKLKRSRSSGTPLDIGFDLKGAGTDALKKCATLIGVALYLYEKDVPVQAPQEQPAKAAKNGTGAPGDAESLVCQQCGEKLTETRFKDGTNWAPTQLAGFGRRKHSKVLCMTHYKEANQAKKRAEEAVAQPPF